MAAFESIDHKAASARFELLSWVKSSSREKKEAKAAISLAISIQSEMIRARKRLPLDSTKMEALANRIQYLIGLSPAKKKGFVLPKEGKSAFSRSIDADRSSPQEKTDNFSKTMEDPQVLACLSTNQSGVPSPPLAFSFPENGFALRTTETGESKEGAVLGGSEIVSTSVGEVAGSVGSAKDEVEADEDGVGDSEIGSEVPSTLDDKVIFLSSGSYAPHMSLSPDFFFG
ncbi:hypothetical protein U1Q18_014486 [Sarracenia purpurea var. burkii]